MDNVTRHLLENGKEGEDEVVEDLEDLAADGDAHLVRTWLVQSERQTVQKYHAHAHSFKPRSDIDQGSTVFEVSIVAEWGFKKIVHFVTTFLNFAWC